MEQDTPRPSIRYDVVHGQEQDVVLVAQTEQDRSHQRSSGQIEWTPGFLGCQSHRSRFSLLLGDLP
jgi:hypothetical protein